MRGDYFINGKDSYLEYGISLTDGALSTLMTFPPLKENIKNKSRKENGSRVIVITKYEDRQVSLPFHLVAKSKTDFFTKYAKFCNNVLSTGVIHISSKYQPTIEYKLKYEQCTQFTEYEQEIAKFVLRCTENDPSDRSLDKNSGLL